MHTNPVKKDTLILILQMRNWLRKAGNSHHQIQGGCKLESRFLDSSFIDFGEYEGMLFII